MDFKKLTRLLIPLVVEGVMAARRNSHDRLVEMLDELQFLTRSINVTKDRITIELQILDVDLLYCILAGEANKFLLASRVSYDRSLQIQDDNAAWQAIEHYYAAYYGVHYLLRLTGISITNLDSRAISAIEKNGLGSFGSVLIPGGLYVMRYNHSSQILTLIKNTKKAPGGSHQEAWHLWKDLVEKLSAETTCDIAEYASTALDLATHKSFLVRSTAKYNPPEIRGEINYQFKGGSWIFEAKAINSIGRIQRSISNKGSQGLIKISNLEGLIDNNKVIIGLAKSIFLHAVEKYPKSICRSISNKYSIYVK